MSLALNYKPEDVKSGEVLIASIAGSGVAFGMLPYAQGEEPELVVISPRQAAKIDARIGDTIELAYVENFPEYVQQVKYRAVAVYRKTTGAPEKPVIGSKPSDMRKTIEQQVEELLFSGEVWNRAEVYRELFKETFQTLTASEVERARYEAIGHSLQRLHDTGVIACAKVYGPAKKNATTLYYAKTTQILGRALMGMDIEEGEDGQG